MMESAAEYLKARGWVQDREGYWLKPSLGKRKHSSAGRAAWTIEGALDFQVRMETVPETITEKRLEPSVLTEERIAERIKELLR